MKTRVFVSVFALFAICVLTGRTSAHLSGPSANGIYHFVTNDDLAKALEFDAQTDERGVTTGRMTLSGVAVITEQEPDGEPPRSEAAEFFMTADLNTLTIENNRALLSGTVTDSSHRTYIGKWVQLVVEDSRDEREPDKLGWTFCQREATGWVPSDAEIPGDEGAWWKWWATDAELREDVGIQSTNIIPGNKKTCQTIALSAYEFAEVLQGEGQIQVLP